MKLEEAIKIIKDIDTLDDIELQEAYETVLHELEHLQKENEELSIKYDNTLHELRILKNECVPKSEIREKIDNRITTVENLLDEMVDKDIGCINISYLSKKEKEEVINKRNCLIVQKATLINMKKDLLKEEWVYEIWYRILENKYEKIL